MLSRLNPPLSLQWYTCKFTLPIIPLPAALDTLVVMLHKNHQGCTALPVTAALLSRLIVLTESPVNELQDNPIYKSLMSVEAVRRETFSSWPHMDYRWSLCSSNCTTIFLYRELRDLLHIQPRQWLPMLKYLTDQFPGGGRHVQKKNIYWSCLPREKAFGSLKIMLVAVWTKPTTSWLGDLLGFYTHHHRQLGHWAGEDPWIYCQGFEFGVVKAWESRGAQGHAPPAKVGNVERRRCHFRQCKCEPEKMWFNWTHRTP